MLKKKNPHRLQANQTKKPEQKKKRKRAVIAQAKSLAVELLAVVCSGISWGGLLQQILALMRVEPVRRDGESVRCIRQGRNLLLAGDWPQHTCRRGDTIDDSHTLGMISGAC